MYKFFIRSKVLFLIIVFSSFLISVCFASVKNLPVPPNSSVVPQQSTKVPAKTENSEVKPPVAPKMIDPYENIIKSEASLIIVNKSEYKLHLFKDGKEIKNYDVAIGKNPGQKERVGDMTTPVGEFTVDEVLDASDWTHDFHDGNGQIEGAYGPWFISLETGWNGIGIHGTHNPSSIKTMASEGCIRMNNKEVAELKELISVGMKVIIWEGELSRVQKNSL